MNSFLSMSTELVINLYVCKFMMELQTCAVKCKIINDKECFWNGCIFQKKNKQFMISTIGPILMMIPCKNLVQVVKENGRNLPNFLLDLLIGIQPDAATQKRKKYRSQFIFAWRSYRFAANLEKIQFSSALLSSDTSSKEFKNMTCCDLHSDDSILSWFGLFSINFPKIGVSKLSFCNELFGLFSINFPKIGASKSPFCNELKPGLDIWTSSYPFAHFEHPAFSNCISKGIVSNVIGDCLLLIDACCLPGSHGAGVYLENSALAGIIICPIEVKNRQLAGITVVCSLKEVLQSLMEQHHAARNIFDSTLFVNPTVKCQSDRRYAVEVVYLRHGTGWGSGVVAAMDKTPNYQRILIATCRHVVAPARNKLAQANFFCGSEEQLSIPARIVYTSPENSWFDFALLEVHCGEKFMSKLCDQMDHYLHDLEYVSIINYARKCYQGLPIFAKGHCIFGTGDVAPTVTKGVVSSVVFAQNDLPVLLHSNCTVLPGASGGGLFSTEMCFYGLIVNNIKQCFEDEKHVLYPKVNFALPAAAFMSAVVSYAFGNSNFDQLDELAKDDCIQSQWNVQSENCSGKFVSSKL